MRSLKSPPTSSFGTDSSKSLLPKMSFSSVSTALRYPDMTIRLYSRLPDHSMLSYGKASRISDRIVPPATSFMISVYFSEVMFFRRYPMRTSLSFPIRYGPSSHFSDTKRMMLYGLQTSASPKR